MLRYALTLVLGCLGLSSSLPFWDFGPSLPEHSLLALQQRYPGVDPAHLDEAIALHNQEVDEARSRRNRFDTFVTRIMTELRCRECSLEMAADQVFYFSLDQYPEYLENIFPTESGSHIKTKVASNLIWTFRLDHHYQPTAELQCLLEQLDLEFRELPYETEAARRQARW